METQCEIDVDLKQWGSAVFAWCARVDYKRLSKKTKKRSMKKNQKEKSKELQNMPGSMYKKDKSQENTKTIYKCQLRCRRSWPKLKKKKGRAAGANKKTKKKCKCERHDRVRSTCSAGCAWLLLMCLPCCAGAAEFNWTLTLEDVYAWAE